MIFDASAEGRSARVEVKGQDDRYSVTIDGVRLEVDVHDAGRGFMHLLVDGHSHDVGLAPHPGGLQVELREGSLLVALSEAARGGRPRPRREASGLARIEAPMPGKLLRVLVEPGEEVSAGQGLVVVEAMKMENELRAPRSGRVKELPAQEGQAVEAGALLAVLE